MRTILFFVLLFSAHIALGETRQEAVDRITRDYGCTIVDAVWQYGASFSPSLIGAVIYRESTGHHKKVNGDSGAQGLMQLLQNALDQLEKIYGPNEFTNDRYDPVNNIQAGVAYLEYILHGYRDGIPYDDPYEALLGFHRGPYGGTKYGTDRAYDYTYIREIIEIQRLFPTILCRSA